ncbi:Tellurite resistance protein TerB [Rosistilla carotiformis]|uniref:Tellurite resistance protein TerB n=1 Tax=Rosistilla carotiformis TaxID=2528017 RepID=A0A518JQV0_9BACT|nr:TerB family tellurite resistance protein [Rosistilla carotiformis]QDV67921.1 Tellurite resistance protein TerB [Rosistilla carotiformis]
MLLIGTTDLRRTRDRGDFRCPQCRQLQPYRLKSVRPFLTLYFIPTIPMGAVQHYVECDECRQAFEPAVLEIDPSTAVHLEQQQFHQEVMNVAVLTVVADGEITEAEIKSLGHVAEMLFGEPTDREDLGRMCAAATQVGYKPHNYLRSVMPRWDRDQKYLAMKAIFMAASAEGDLTPEQLEALVAVRRTLGLSEEDFQAAIEEALAIADQFDR